MAAPRNGNKGLPKISNKIGKIKPPKISMKVKSPKLQGGGKIRQPKGEMM